MRVVVCTQTLLGGGEVCRGIARIFQTGAGGHPVKQRVLTRLPCQPICHVTEKGLTKGGTRVPQRPPSQLHPWYTTERLKGERKCDEIQCMHATRPEYVICL